MKRLLITTFTILLAQPLLGQDDARSVCISEISPDEYSADEYPEVIDECVKEIEAYGESQGDAGLLDDYGDSTGNIEIEAP